MTWTARVSCGSAARRLERRAPSFLRKGRIRVGADADLAVFNPATVTDNATYEDPSLASTGFTHVLVNGVPIVRDGRFREDTFPGRAARAPSSNS